MGRRGSRRKQILDDIKATRLYLKLKDEAPDRTLWGNVFGSVCGAFVRHITE